MSYLLFIDESGVDQRESPYEVLAGVAIRDRKLWELIRKVQQAELAHFGQRYAPNEREVKAKILLKRKTFRLAGQLPRIDPGERTDLARECLNNGGVATRRQLAALAQAKLDFVRVVLRLCGQCGVRLFASIVPQEAQRPGGQMGKYFQETRTGRQRASRIIPEPFFVHSNLTTAIQLADLVAYIVSWGLRNDLMTRPGRPELEEFAGLVWQLRYKTRRENHSSTSFVVIDDLRPMEERKGIDAWREHQKRKGKAGFPAKPPR